MSTMRNLHDLFLLFFPVFYGENDTVNVVLFCGAAKLYYVRSETDVGISDWQVFLFCAIC
jgi:hypothetical protein